MPKVLLNEKKFDFLYLKLNLYLLASIDTIHSNNQYTDIILLTFFHEQLS